MNHVELLKNGHHTICEAIDGLADHEWELPNVVGQWSVKDLIAHLAAYEQVLVDLFSTLLCLGRPTPTLDRFREQYVLAFDEDEVARRQATTAAATLAEYETAHAQTIFLLSQVPEALSREQGVMPWEGSPYDLEDFLIYTAYGHKQEHAAQIAAWRDRLARQSVNGCASRVVIQTFDLTQSNAAGRSETIPNGTGRAERTERKVLHSDVTIRRIGWYKLRSNPRRRFSWFPSN
jgi:hypothetical protein